jgi:phage terminase large subunit
VFPEWDEYDEEPDIAPIYGLDFGFSNDPTAIPQVKIHKQDMYLREILYKKGLTTPDLDQAMKFLIPNHSRMSADAADPKTIKDLNRRGWSNIVASEKGPDSIINGINWIKGFKLHVHKDSHNLKNELLNYQWVMYGGKATNTAIDSHNHLIDGIRYTKTIHRIATGLHVSFH